MRCWTTCLCRRHNAWREDRGISLRKKPEPISSRGSILIAAAFGLAISAALFSDLLLLTAFLAVLGVIAEEAIWTSIVAWKGPDWFRVSGEPQRDSHRTLDNAEVLFTDQKVEQEFYLDRKVTSGSLEILTDLEFLKLSPAKISSNEKEIRIRALFRSHFSGEYVSGNLTFALTSPLKLFRKSFSVPVALDYSVFPRTVEVALESMRLFGKAGIGETPIDTAGIGTEFYDLREYQAGDDFRQINWQATARTGEIIVNQKMKEVGAAYYIVLDARAEDYYDRDRLAATFLQLANALLALNTRFGVLVHDGETVRRISRLDAPQRTLAAALSSALEFAEIPTNYFQNPLRALSEIREELVAVPFYKLNSNQKWLTNHGLTILAQIEKSAHSSQRVSLLGSDPVATVFELVKESQFTGESKPPSILYVSALNGSMARIVELASEIRKIYDSEFVVVNPTAPWIVAPDEDSAYELYSLRKRKIKVLANSEIEYYVGDPVTITHNLFGAA
jgi:uncharacterized protein (DUF58 family)